MSATTLLSRRRWLSAACLATLGGCGPAATGERIWVGHLARLSDRREGAEAAINAMQLTLADAQESEGGAGARGLGVRHVDAPTRERARAEASRLLAVNRAACLIVGADVDGLSDVVAVALAHGAAVVAVGEVTDRALAEQTFLLGVDPRTRGEALARFAIAAGRKKRAAVVQTTAGESAAAAVDGFSREYRRGGGEVASWRSVEQLRGSAGAPEVILATHPVAPAGWAPLVAVGVPVIALGAAGLEGEAASQKGEVWAPTLQPDPSGFPAAGRAWIERYEKRFGQAPSDDALLAHDAIALVIDAIRRDGGDERQRLVEDLGGRGEVVGLTGTITRKGGRPNRPLFLRRYRNGKRLPAVPLPAP